MIRPSHIDEALARYRRRLVSSAAAAVLLGGWVAPAYADATIDTALEGLAPMTSDDLSGQRGGFSFGNMNISFGFSIATTVAGGTLGPGITVTTNFTVNMPGDLQNLGTTITDNVSNQLKEKGLIDDGDPATPTLQQTIEDKVNTSLANVDPNVLDAPEVTTVASAPAALPPAPDSAPAPTPVVEVTLASTPDVPPPVSADTPPVVSGASAPASPVAAADPAKPATTLPLGIKPDGLPEAAPAQTPPVAASIDPATGNVKLAFGSGGSTLLEYLQGQISKIQNTENNLQITSEFTAEYVIDGYSGLTTAMNLGEQVRNLTDQLMALGGH